MTSKYNSWHFFPFESLFENHIEHITLQNGLNVVVYRFNSPAIGLGILFKGGPAYENLYNNGISHALEHMLFRGTKNYPTSEELLLALDETSSDTNAATYTDFIIITSKILPEALSQSLQIFYEMLTEPLFNGLEAEKEIILEELLEDYDEEGNLIALDQLASQLLYPSHPYGYPILGSKEFIKQLTKDQLHFFLKKITNPQNIVLCLAGQIPDNNTLVSILSRNFEKLQPYISFAEIFKVDDVPVYRGPKVQWINTPKSQISCRIVFRALSYTDVDFIGLKSIVRLLDFQSGSPLRIALQEEKGLCYSLYVGLEAFEKSGSVFIEFVVKPDMLIEAIFESLRVLSRLKDRKISNVSNNHLIKQYIKEKRFASNDLWEFSIKEGFNILFNNPITFKEEFYKTQQVNPFLIQKISKRVLKNRNLGIILVGPYNENDFYKISRMVENFE